MANDSEHRKVQTRQKARRSHAEQAEHTDRSLRVLRAIGKHTPISWWTIDPDGNYTGHGGCEGIEFAEDAVRKWKASPKNFFELINLPDASKAVRSALEGVPANYRIEIAGRVTQEVYLPVFKDDEVVEMIAISTDVTPEVELARELQYQAEHDSLTGLLNRTGFERHVDDFLSQSLDGAALIMIDISGMRDLNDLRGHQIGDHALTVIAGRIRELSGEDAGCGRIGSDEFCVFVRGVDRREVDQLTADLLASITDPIAAPDGELRLIAYAAADGPQLSGSTFREVLPALDISLTEARCRGHNSSVRFSPMMISDFTERASLTREIELAIRDRAFSVAYQPIWSARTGRLAGAEALARWEHPTRGEISPNEFIPLATNAELVTAIDQQIAERAIGEFGAWCEAHHEMRSVQLSINLSAKNLADQGLADRLMGLVEAHGLAAQDLALEITEADALESLTIAEGSVLCLRERGFPISIDDFGTGYSSLNQLQHLSVDALKIDRSFVSGGVTAKQQELCQLIVGLAKALNLFVIAEGVETQAQLDHMRSLGCNFVQGFLLARPLPPDEFVDLVVAMHGKVPLEFDTSGRGPDRTGILDRSRDGVDGFLTGGDRPRPRPS